MSRFTTAVLLLALVVVQLDAAAPFPFRTDLDGNLLPPGAIARLGSQRLRHPGPIYSLVLSPDGKRVVAAGGGNFLLTWDLRTGKLLSERKPHRRRTNVVAISPDSRLLASAGDDSTIALSEFASGKELRRLKTNQPLIFALAFSPDSKVVASAGESNQARPLCGSVALWDVKTGKRLHEFAGHASAAQSVAFSREGKFLVSGGTDNMVRLWQPGTDKEQVFSGHEDHVRSVAFSPDGRTLASGSADKTLRLWDVKTEKELKSFPMSKGVRELAFSPDGKRLAVAVLDGTVRVVDVTARSESRQLSGHGGPVNTVAFARDGKRLVSGGEEGRRARVWEVATGEEVSRVEGHDAPVSAVVFSREGKKVFSVAGRTVWGWSPRSGRGGPVWASDGGEVRGLAISPDGQLFTTHEGTSPRVRGTSDGKLLLQLEGHAEGATAVVFSSENRFVVSAGWDWKARRPKDNDTWEFSVRIWSAETGPRGPRLVRVSKLEMRSGERWGAVAFSSDGSKLAGSFRLSALQVWDSSTGRLLRNLAPAGGAVLFSQFAFSPDGSALASADNQGFVYLWETASGQLITRYKAHGGAGQALAFSPDGLVLASGGLEGAVMPPAALDGAAGMASGEVCLWSIPQGRVLRRLRGHRSWVQALAFSPDGKLLASGSGDRTTLVWDMEAARGHSVPSARLTVRELDALWADLRSDAAARANRAMWRLVAAPAQAVPLLRPRLRAAWGAELKVPALIKQLDDDEFEVREKASAELEKLGPVILPFLQAMLKAKPSLELALRIRRLQEQIEAPANAPVPLDRLRGLRAVIVLERIGSAEARAALQDLTKGGLMLEAKAALVRLTRRAGRR